MNKLISTLALAFLTAGLITAATARAQTNAPPPGAVADAAQSTPPSDSAAPAPAPDAPQYSVLAITSVELMHSSHAPALDIVRVQGLASTDGWSDPQLVPLTKGVPKDGVLNLVLVAHAPADATEPTGFSPVAALFPIEASHPPYKAIRVFGATNSVTLRGLPGYAETKLALKDCGGCIGKYFAADGATPPAGVSAADVVRPQDLPNLLRVIKPSDGISMTDYNPNRLTLLLGDDGRIDDAAWN